MQQQLFRVARVAAVRGMPRFNRGFAVNRGFATAAPTDDLEDDANLPYAQALFQQVIEAKHNPAVVAAQLNQISENLENPVYKELKEYLSDTDIKIDAKAVKMTEIGKDKELKADFPAFGAPDLKEGGKLPAADTGFWAKTLMEVVAEENAVDEWSKIAEDFEALSLTHLKQIKCRITSAAALTKQQVTAVEGKIKGMVDKGMTPLISYDTDPDIIGGLVLHMGGTYQDLSVRTALINSQKFLQAEA